MKLCFLLLKVLLGIMVMRLLLSRWLVNLLELRLARCMLIKVQNVFRGLTKCNIGYLVRLLSMTRCPVWHLLCTVVIRLRGLVSVVMFVHRVKEPIEERTSLVTPLARLTIVLGVSRQLTC